MAVNPLIALQGRLPDVGRTFSNILTNLTRANALEQSQVQAPIRNRLLEAQTQTLESAVPTDEAEFIRRQNERKISLAQGAQSIIPDLQAGNIERVRNTLQQRGQALLTSGIDNSDTVEALELLDTDPGELLRISQDAIRLAQPATPQKTVRAFAPVTIVNPVTKEKRLVAPTFDPNTQTASLRPFDIPAGFEVSRETPEEKRTADLATSTQKQKQVGDIKIEQDIKREIGKENAKLNVQRKLKPEVESAVTTAVLKATDAFDITTQERSNRVALNLYQVGMKGLSDALANTDTGPFVGILPAITANQQFAEGAISAMAPILKQMFRASGEGIFTDKDQELLLDMVPKRRDKRAAIEAKLNNIDLIVQAKLLTDVPPSDQVVPSQPLQPQQLQPVQIQPGQVPPAVIRFNRQGQRLQ